MHTHKYIPRGSEWERVNLHWSPSVRAPRDQRTPGRASSGVMFASPLKWEEESLQGTPLERFSKEGRVCVTKVHYSASRFAWIATIYAHVTKNNEHRAQNQLMLSALFEYFASRSIIIMGDFNVELDGDLASIQAIQTEAFVDISGAITDQTPLPTYVCASAASCIDRVVVSRSMWTRIDSFWVIQDMATGPHRPIVVQFTKQPSTAHPRLNNVGEILPGNSPPTEEAIATWQVSKMPDFLLFEEAARNQDVDRMYYLWSSIWESFLLLDVPTDFDWGHCLGRAAAAVQYSKGEAIRQGRAVLTDAERQLWRLKGLAQLLHQGRAIYEKRTWRRLRLLWSSVSARRTLPVPEQDNLDELPDLIEKITAAIAHERALAQASKSVKWKQAISQTGGVNKLTRRMLVGPGTPVHIVRHNGIDLTCPQEQADLLSTLWSEIGRTEHPTDVPPSLLNRCRPSPLALHRHTAASVRKQVRALKPKAAHSLDWWRPAELKRLPDTAFAMLANIYNVSEDLGHLPSALQRGMIAAISKGSSIVGPLQVRPICLLPMLHRVWSSSRFQDLADWADKVTSESQAAFKRRRSAQGEVVQLVEHMNKRCMQGKGGYIGQLDLSKAFPRLCHRKAIDIVVRKGAPQWLANIMHEACLRKHLAWKVNGRLSNFVQQTQGTPQGCALSILLFQLTIAPIVEEVEAKILADKAHARLLVYADDVVIYAESLDYLQELLTISAHLMTQMGMMVNETKSSVTPVGCELPYTPHLNGFPLPTLQHTDILGCSLLQAATKLPAPQALAKDTKLRTLLRKHKVTARLERLRHLAVHTEAKEALWRQMILPILAYDPWVALPSNQSARAWRTLVVSSIYSSIAGRKDSATACSIIGSPHQTDYWSISTHECMRIAYDYISELPVEELMQATVPARFHTPTTALVALFRMKKFEATPEGIARDDLVIQWPPASKEECLHELRAVLRVLLSREFLNDTGPANQFDKPRSSPCSCLTQTQRNFWRTIQLGAHKALIGGECGLCNEPLSLDHALWHCEGRRLKTALSAPAGRLSWPVHFRNRGLLTEKDEIDPFDVLSAQKYMTTVLIERREDERSITAPPFRPTDNLDEVLDLIVPNPENLGSGDPRRVGTGFNGNAASSTDSWPTTMHPTLPPTTNFGGRAASSTDPLPTTPLGPTALDPVFHVLSSEDEPEPALDDAQATTVALPHKRRRTAWRDLDVPPHITTCQDLLTEKLECQLCGARTTAQYRVKFVKLHMHCQGIASKVSEGLIARSSRVHIRRKRVYQQLSLACDDPRQLSAEWHLEHGKLMLHMSQHDDFADILCVLCGSRAPNAARRIFLTKHASCLQAITTRDEDGAKVCIDMDALRCGAQRCAAGLSPLCSKRRKTRS
eukprot:5260137-Amphidinium_carterae.1